MAGKTTAGSLNIEIRSPRDDEWPACRMLVPEAFSGAVKPHILLAFDKSGKAILGAAAYRIEKDRLHLVRVRVVRTHRRAGIGTELLRRVPEGTLGGQSAVVSAMVDAMAEPEAEAFLGANGFNRVSRLHVLEVDLEPMRAAMAKLLDRARRSRRLPPSARLARPSEAPAKELASIYEDQILARRRFHPSLVEAVLTEERFEHSSSVLLVDGHVVAMVMVSYDREHRRANVPAKVVLEGFRGGLANISVMADALEKGHAAGIERVRFESLDDNGDTRKLAQRFGGDTVHIYDRFVRVISPEGR